MRVQLSSEAGNLNFGQLLHLQPRNYQVSKNVVHEVKFGDIAVMQM